MCVVSNCFTGGLYFSGKCMLKAYCQDVLAHPILYPQTCLAVPGWLCSADLTVRMLLVLGAELLLHWVIPECKLC